MDVWIVDITFVFKLAIFHKENGPRKIQSYPELY